MLAVLYPMPLTEASGSVLYTQGTLAVLTQRLFCMQGRALRKGDLVPLPLTAPTGITEGLQVPSAWMPYYAGQAFTDTHTPGPGLGIVRVYAQKSLTQTCHMHYIT